jgi:hypothetical protein
MTDEKPELTFENQTSPHVSVWSCSIAETDTLRFAAERFAAQAGGAGRITWFEEGNSVAPCFLVEGVGRFGITTTWGPHAGRLDVCPLGRFDVYPAGRCLNCGSAEGVEMESSRTMYHWEGEGPDPNRPLPLCRECAKEHHENWDDQWSDYYGGLL